MNLEQIVDNIEEARSDLDNAWDEIYSFEEYIREYNILDPYPDEQELKEKLKGFLAQAEMFINKVKENLE